MMAVYPVILTRDGETVLIEVPDLEILTEAGSIAEAISMARDAIGLKCITLEDDGQSIPTASALDAVDPAKGTFADAGPGITSLVDVDLAMYRQRLDQRMVRRNVTIPAWMDREATQAKINVSRVLQNALAQALKAL